MINATPEPLKSSNYSTSFQPFYSFSNCTKIKNFDYLYYRLFELYTIILSNINENVDIHTFSADIADQMKERCPRMQLSQAVMKLTEDVVRFRRELHKIPELGLEEFKTKEYLLKQLQSFGIKEIYPVLDTGLIAVFRSENQGRR